MARSAALSPSRTKDFHNCPLKFRLRVIDRIPEPPSLVALRGTLVHSGLEHLFDLPAAERDIAHAHVLLDERWEAMLAKNPQHRELFTSPEEQAEWLKAAHSLLENYFSLEMPQNLSPRKREHFVEARLPSGLRLRGIVDRLDVAPSGAIRVIDYKTGKAPSPRFQEEAIFQMRFYAGVIYLSTGTLPSRTQLLYLGDKQVLTYDPGMADVSVLTSYMDDTWNEIDQCLSRGDFPTRKNPLCNYCYFKQMCPQWGGSLPQMPEAGVQALRTAVQ